MGASENSKLCQLVKFCSRPISPAAATRCTDHDEIWHEKANHCCLLIFTPISIGVGMEAPDIPLLVKSGVCTEMTGDAPIQVKLLWMSISQIRSHATNFFLTADVRGNLCI